MSNCNDDRVEDQHKNTGTSIMTGNAIVSALQKQAS